MRIMSAVLLLGLAACADPGDGQTGSANGGMAAITIRNGAGEPADCALSVRFGSYAMGIDRGAARSVEALVADDPVVRAVTRHPWGREGEYTLCVETASDEGARALLGRIRPLLPAAPRGPVTIILRDGTRFDAPPR